MGVAGVQGEVPMEALRPAAEGVAGSELRAIAARSARRGRMMAQTAERAAPDRRDLYAFRRVYRLVSERFGTPQRDALDYGCGTGYGTLILSKAFRSVVGIDVDRETIDYCIATHHAGNLRFELFDPMRQPYPNSSYDCVFSFQVLEHVPERLVGKYLSNIWSMLRPGGVAVLTTPRSENYYGGHSGNPYHVKEYSENELRAEIARVLPENCFQVRYVEDVLSTRARLRILRAGRNSIPARAIARIVSGLLVLFETRGLISVGYRAMTRSNYSKQAVGSYWVELRR
jgi:SAM-dependent methyltransferase